MAVLSGTELIDRRSYGSAWIEARKHILQEAGVWELRALVGRRRRDAMPRVGRSAASGAVGSLVCGLGS